MIPALLSLRQLLEQLFVDNSRAEPAKQAVRITEGRSFMDLVTEDARRSQAELEHATRIGSINILPAFEVWKNEWPHRNKGLAHQGSRRMPKNQSALETRRI